MLYLAFYHRTCTYLLRQGAGQLHVLLNARPLSDSLPLTARSKSNLLLLPDLKKYSVDSLGYDHSDSYSKIYFQGSSPVIWGITASQAYSLQPYYWTFPLVGRVSYKGFFNKELAALELNELRSRGFDVEISPVTAYSTLGWFSDPLFSGMLERNKGSFCNLIFHELFHATYYAPGSVNLNENLASFIAHKATIKFLQNDTIALTNYLNGQADLKIIRDFEKRQIRRLEEFYEIVKAEVDKDQMKEALFREIADSAAGLLLSDSSRASLKARQIMAARNAYFVGYKQYESLQDSLEEVFNKNYRANIKKMVHYLKRR